MRTRKAWAPVIGARYKRVASPRKQLSAHRRELAEHFGARSNDQFADVVIAGADFLGYFYVRTLEADPSSRPSLLVHRSTLEREYRRVPFPDGTMTRTEPTP